MADNMVRTQVYLPKATYQALVERARQQGLTMAVQIRAALDEYLQRSQDEDEGPILQPDDPLFAMMGIFDSGVPDIAVNHDHYLYGTPKRNPATGQFLRETRKTSGKSRRRRPTSRRKPKP
jgi:hypothetical protein